MINFTNLQWLGQWTEFWTNIASRLSTSSLFFLSNNFRLWFFSLQMGIFQTHSEVVEKFSRGLGLIVFYGLSCKRQFIATLWQHTGEKKNTGLILPHTWPSLWGLGDKCLCKLGKMKAIEAEIGQCMGCSADSRDMLYNSNSFNIYRVGLRTGRRF